MCVQFVVQSSVQYSHELYKSQVRKKIKELAKKIHVKIFNFAKPKLFELTSRSARVPSLSQKEKWNINGRL